MLLVYCYCHLHFAAYVENPDENECPEIELFKDPNKIEEKEAEATESTQATSSTDDDENDLSPPPKREEDAFDFLFE